MARPRKPNSLKLLHGDRADRINENEPKSPAGLGTPPTWFDDLARSAWKRIDDALTEMKLASRADAEAAMLYCQAYSTWRKATMIVLKEGFSVETETTTKAHPLLPTIAESARQMARILAQFGMTPSARAGLHVEAGAEDDPILAFLARKSEPPSGKSKAE